MENPRLSLDSTSELSSFSAASDDSFHTAESSGSFVSTFESFPEDSADVPYDDTTNGGGGGGATGNDVDTSIEPEPKPKPQPEPQPQPEPEPQPQPNNPFLVKATTVDASNTEGTHTTGSSIDGRTSHTTKRSRPNGEYTNARGKRAKTTNRCSTSAVTATAVPTSVTTGADSKDIDDSATIGIKANTNTLMNHAKAVPVTSNKATNSRVDDDSTPTYKRPKFPSSRTTGLDSTSLGTIVSTIGTQLSPPTFIHFEFIKNTVFLKALKAKTTTTTLIISASSNSMTMKRNPSKDNINKKRKRDDRCHFTTATPKDLDPVLEEIFLFLDPKSLIEACRVCKIWLEACKNEPVLTNNPLVPYFHLTLDCSEYWEPVNVFLEKMNYVNMNMYQRFELHVISDKDDGTLWHRRDLRKFTMEGIESFILSWSSPSTTMTRRHYNITRLFLGMFPNLRRFDYSKSNLTSENIDLLQKERPEIEFVS